MVVVRLEPTIQFMERAGMAAGTRRVAHRLWNGRLPDGEPAALVRELYAAENAGRPDPSGSQDMIGLIYPGICRLDYDFRHEGGVFPRHIESTSDPQIVGWLEQVIQVIPVAPRPAGYSPLAVQNLEASWIGRLGRSGKDCYAAILRRDLDALGASMNECMRCWEAILPHTVRHPTLTVDLVARLRYFQSRYPGAMYSGCGGGYLYVVSEKAVPDSFRVTVCPDSAVRAGR
jgi:hypothetical protein